MLAAHPNIHIFDRPKAFLLKVKGISLALAGFPHVRQNIRQNFLEVLEQTGWCSTQANASVLCIHQCVEGATLIMGPRLYTFRNNHDVIKLSDIPSGFAAVLSGHIHRFQVLTKDLWGNPIASPVLYPGSIERTSFTEKDETKGFLTLEIAPSDSMPDSSPARGTLQHWQFHQLPALPMTQLELHGEGMDAHALEEWIKNSLSRLPKESVVKIRIRGRLPNESLEVLSAESLRSLTPPTMNLTVTLVDYRHSSRKLIGQ
jgi:DNA repair exonuclease SbcCD nuclease subunit